MKYFLVFFLQFCYLSFVYSQDIKQKIEKLSNSIIDYQLVIDTLIIKKEKLFLQLLHNEIKEFCLPKLKEGEELIEHNAMILVYSEEHEQAKWVAHIISTKIIDGTVGRTNDFRIDPKIKTGSSEEIDYFIDSIEKLMI